MAVSYLGFNIITKYLYIISNLLILILVCVDLVKSKASSAQNSAASELILPQGKTTAKAIVLLILQFLTALFMSQSMLIFLLIELVAVPAILIHVWAKGKGAGNTAKLNKIKRIGALLVYLYCKVIFVVIIFSMQRGVIASQKAFLLLVILEAASLYIAVCHMFLGLRIKKTPANSTYQDLGFIFTDNSMLPTLIAACIGAFLIFLTSLGRIVPYEFVPTILAASNFSILMLLINSFGKLKKLSPAKVMILLSGLGAIAGVAAAFVLSSREFRQLYLPSYVMAFRTFNAVSNCVMIALPIGVLLTKQSKPVMKILAGVTAVFGSISLATDIGLIPYSPLTFALGQAALCSFFAVSIYLIKQKKQAFTHQ